MVARLKMWWIFVRCKGLIIVYIYFCCEGWRWIDTFKRFETYTCQSRWELTKYCWWDPVVTIFFLFCQGFHSLHTTIYSTIATLDKYLCQLVLVTRFVLRQKMQSKTEHVIAQILDISNLSAFKNIQPNNNDLPISLPMFIRIPCSQSAIEHTTVTSDERTRCAFRRHNGIDCRFCAT